MSSSNVNDDKQIGNADRDQKDKDQRAREQQRQQSTGQPKSPGTGQQGGQDDDRTGQQGGKGGIDQSQSGKTQR
jgi:hypothetical protein